LSVNSGFADNLAENFGNTAILDDCLDTVLEEDARDLFTFESDHKIRSYYDNQLCLEGASDKKSVMVQPCNNGNN